MLWRLAKWEAFPCSRAFLSVEIAKARFTAGLLDLAFPLRVVKWQGLVKVPCGLAFDQERMDSPGAPFSVGVQFIEAWSLVSADSQCLTG